MPLNKRGMSEGLDPRFVPSTGFQLFLLWWPLSHNRIQSNSIIVESIIVENSIIVDNLPSTEDFYLIKIQNSRNSKIVEVFLGKVA